MENSLIVTIQIPADEFIAHYQGAAKEVVALAHDGTRIRFPSKILQPFVSRHGVSGTFRIEYDERNKFKSIKKINN